MNEVRAWAWLLGAAVLAVAGLLYSRRAAADELPESKVVPDVNGKPVTRGIRNNNPGNLRPGDSWRGITGVDDQNYLIFDNAPDGIRAMTINLIHQTTKHGLTTVREIVSKWAPLSENPQQPAYIDNVANALDVGPDDHLDLAHARDQVTAFVLAVIRQENGVQPYDESTIAAGITAGLRDA